MFPALALVLLTAAPAGASREGGVVRLAQRNGGVIGVVTTSTDLKALVAAVGGERVAVESLAPALHDPHAVARAGRVLHLRDGRLAAAEADTTGATAPPRRRRRTQAV